MTLLISSLLGWVSAGVEPPTLGVAIPLVDFVERFAEATAENALETSVSQQQLSGGVALPGIFQHPLNEGWARLTYSLDLSGVADDERLLLIFSLGIRDGARQDDPDAPFDGVICGVEVDGRRFFEATVHDFGWREHSLELTSFRGRVVDLSFVVSANDTSNYDWFLWGQPRLYRLRTVPAREAPARIRSGLLWYRDAAGQGHAHRFQLDESQTPSEAGRALLTRLLEAAPAEWGLFAFQPRLRIRRFGAGQHVLFMGKDYEVRCVVQNVGEAPLEEFHNVLLGISGAAVRRGRADRRLLQLDPGEEVQLAWEMRGTRHPVVEVAVEFKQGAQTLFEAKSTTATLRFHRAVPPLPPRTARELRSVVQREYALLENAVLRLTFVREEDRFSYMILSAQKGGNLLQMATMEPFSRVRYQDSEGRAHWMDLSCQEVTMRGSSEGEATLHFTGLHQDEEGVEWSFEAVFTLVEDSHRVITEYRLRTSEPRELFHFSGPMLRVGDGAFGARKEFALFPGLEMLEKDEVSSSTRDAAPPLHLRLAPHPYKITIPLMAVQQGGVTVGVLWDPLQPWGGVGPSGLSAVFASPNWYDNEANHLLGVFLPLIPDPVPENSLLARRPIVLDRHGIALRAEIFADPRGTIFDVPSIYAEAFGFPKPAEPPRSDEEELFLSRHGFLVTTWDPETRKSRHCVDWPPQNAPGFATLLWYDYLATNDEEVRQRVQEIAEQTIAEEGPEGLASPANCHILRWEFPFYYGYVREGLRGARRQIEPILRSQTNEGGWRFQPRSEKHRKLGKPGDIVLGTCAGNALRLLKYARISGDQEALQAGLKALDYMKRFSIPRGAQAWECPLYEPDLLAAAWAVGAYLEGHLLTGEEQYLERAKYWAKTGLPFLYFWNLPDRPVQRFASIPVFGTTFYTHPWFGVPVQWNGLVYAYYVQRLARWDAEYPWERIAEGILVSAMYQQWTEGPLKGTYPDGLYEQFTQGRGPHINPEDIMVNLLALRGHDPDIRTVLVRRPEGPPIHVSSGASIQEAVLDEVGLRLEVMGFPPHWTFLYLAPIPPIVGITLGEETLPRVSPLMEGPGRPQIGWNFDPETSSALIAFPQPTRPASLYLRFGPEGAESSESQEKPTSDSSAAPSEPSPEE